MKDNAYSHASGVLICQTTAKGKPLSQATPPAVLRAPPDASIIKMTLALIIRFNVITYSVIAILWMLK